MCTACFCFFFFKQKTAYEMRISDWSSDVCSSDLRAKADAAFRGREIGLDSGRETIGFARLLTERLDDLHRPHLLGGGRADVGDAVLAGPRDLDRKSVV